jgi:hypothetical protein
VGHWPTPKAISKSTLASQAFGHFKVMRVRMSPLWPYVERCEVSIAKADRSLADPEFMRRFHKIVAEAEVASAV